MSEEPKTPARGKSALDRERKFVLHTWAKQRGYTSPLVVGGEGSCFFDSSGNRYIDFASQAMCNNLGHQHPEIIRAITKQANEICYAVPSLTTEPRGLLAEKIAEITPGSLRKTLFTNCGAEANENAIKIARFYTGKHKIITRWRSYHGATAGAMTLSGDPRRWAMEPGIPGVVRVLDCYCYRCPFGLAYPECQLRCAEHVSEVIALEGNHTVAAVLIEPIVGSNGIFVPPDGYLQRIADICKKNDILLILDEVMTGFGRTGKWFACQHWNVDPDIMTLAKGLTSAHAPLGATVVSSEIAEFFNDRILNCGLTYSGHALACAAGLAAIGVYENDNVIENASTLGELLGSELGKMAAKHPSIGEVRGRGLFWAIEMVRDRQTREPFVKWNDSSPILQQITKEAMNRGLYLQNRWNFFWIVPPLVISEKELLRGLSIVDDLIAQADQEVVTS